MPLQIPQLNSPRISRNSKTPCLPASHRAARKAPRAKPSRLRAVCRSVMVSAAESNPTSCGPGYNRAATLTANRAGADPGAHELGLDSGCDNIQVEETAADSAGFAEA